MAEFDTTSTKIGNYQVRLIGLPNLKLPVIKIPDDAWDKEGRCFSDFIINTDAGEVRAKQGCGVIQCYGSIEALSAYGLFRPEWAPGQAGSLINKMRQTVLFTDDGPALVLGRFVRNQYAEDLPHITIVRVGARFNAEVPYTPEQERLRSEKIDMAMALNKAAKQSHDTWIQAKAARCEGNSPLAQWKRGVLDTLERDVELLDGSRVFDCLPAIKLSPDDLIEAKQAFSALVKVVLNAQPVIDDIEINSNNVVSLREYAYRHLHSQQAEVRS